MRHGSAMAYLSALALGLLGLSLPVSFLAPARAASFDCSKATTPLEKQICASPDFSREDEVLSRAYATAIGGLSETARTQMQKDQRAWLDYVPLSCSTDAKSPQSFTDDQAACLVSAFTTRVTDLEQSRMLGGWRFYTAEHWAVLDDPDPEWWGGVATKHYSSPRIDDTVPEAEAFNAMMAEKDKTFGKMFDADGTLTDTEVTSDTDVTVKVATVTSDRIGLSINSYWMGHGAAHGNYAVNTLHYLIKENRELVAADVFTGDGWQQALADKALAALDATIPDGIWEDARKDVPGFVTDVTRWDFSDQGLVLQFQPYEVTAYAYGAPTVTIPWSDLTDYLAEGYETRVLY
jgi:uncharacterized protein YecT (DUF1311 family)